MSCSRRARPESEPNRPSPHSFDNCRIHAEPYSCESCYCLLAVCNSVRTGSLSCNTIYYRRSFSILNSRRREMKTLHVLTVIFMAGGLLAFTEPRSHAQRSDAESPPSLTEGTAGSLPGSSPQGQQGRDSSGSMGQSDRSGGLGKSGQGSLGSGSLDSSQSGSSGLGGSGSSMGSGSGRGLGSSGSSGSGMGSGGSSGSGGSMGSGGTGGGMGSGGGGGGR